MFANCWFIEKLRVYRLVFDVQRYEKYIFRYISRPQI